MEQSNSSGPEKQKQRRRRPRGVLILILCVVALIAVGLLVSTGGPRVPQRAYVVLRVGAELPARPPDDLEAFVFGLGGPSIPDLYRTLTYAVSDKRIAGVLLDLRGGNLDLADAHELRDLLVALRSSGKTVVAYSNDMSLRAWYVTTAADAVVLNPAGYLRLTGLGLKVFLFGELLEKLGLEADLKKVGRYKTAYETLTSTELTQPSRQVLESLVDESWNELLADIARARGLDQAALKEIIDGGPLPAKAAQEKKLVDALVWRHELEAFVKEKIGGANLEPFAWSLYADAVRGAGTKVAYFPLTGSIMSGSTAGRGILAADTAARHLGRLAEDPEIAAVVLRVDSPGGDALASARLFQAVRATRKKKPVVVTMGEAAASGGYYVAAGADFIVAHPFTLTGSIGIFGGKVVAAGLLNEVGLRQENFRRGAYAGFYDPLTPFDEAARTKLLEELSFLYDRFLTDVAEGRRTEVEAVRDVAEGRVWSGREAVERKLVDELGGLPRAVAKAAELARIHGGVDLVLWPPRKSWYEELFSGGGNEAVDGRLRMGIIDLLKRNLFSARPLALSPFTVMWE